MLSHMRWLRPVHLTRWMCGPYMFQEFIFCYFYEKKMLCDKLYLHFIIGIIIIIICVFFKNVMFVITWLKCLCLFFPERSTWTTGPTRPTRSFWYSRVGRNRCEYPLRFTLHTFFHKDKHCTGEMANLELLCSTAILPAEGAVNGNT